MSSLWTSWLLGCEMGVSTCVGQHRIGRCASAQDICSARCRLQLRSGFSPRWARIRSPSHQIFNGAHVLIFPSCHVSRLDVLFLPWRTGASARNFTLRNLRRSALKIFRQHCKPGASVGTCRVTSTSVWGIIVCCSTSPVLHRWKRRCLGQNMPGCQDPTDTISQNLSSRWCGDPRRNNGRRQEQRQKSNGYLLKATMRWQPPCVCSHLEASGFMSNSTVRQPCKKSCSLARCESLCYKC